VFTDAFRGMVFADFMEVARERGLVGLGDASNPVWIGPLGKAGCTKGAGEGWVSRNGIYLKK